MFIAVFTTQSHLPPGSRRSISLPDLNDFLSSESSLTLRSRGIDRPLRRFPWRKCVANTMDVSQCYLDTLVGRDVHTCNSGHAVQSPLPRYRQRRAVSCSNRNDNLPQRKNARELRSLPGRRGSDLFRQHNAPWFQSLFPRINSSSASSGCHRLHSALITVAFERLGCDLFPVGIDCHAIRQPSS